MTKVVHRFADSLAHPAERANPLRMGIGRALWCLDRTAWYTRLAWTHPANRGRASSRVGGCLRLGRLWFRARVLRRRTIAAIGDRSVMWADPSRWATLKAVCANPPDVPEMMVWRKYLRRGDIFIDVGANAGSYTIWAAELGAEVIALEPVKDTYDLLVENLKLNGYEAKTIQAAVGASSGVVRFTSGQDDQNHIDSSGDIEVEMVTIDLIIGAAEIAGMKIDVEGFEIDVLRGCVRSLREQRIGLMQLEWNSTSERAVGTNRGPVAELLNECGYGLYRPDSSGNLVPITDHDFGDDVFACPTSGTNHMRVFEVSAR